MRDSIGLLHHAAHLRHALAWCYELERTPGNRTVVRQLATELIEHAERLQEELDQIPELTALENVRSAVNAFLLGPDDDTGTVQSLSDLDYAMTRLKALFGYPPPPSVDGLRSIYHDFENRLGGLRAENALRRALASAEITAAELKQPVVTARLREIADPAAIDAAHARTAILGLLDSIQSEVTEAHRLRHAASRTLAQPPIRGAVVVDDIDHQRAQMRYAVELATSEFGLEAIDEAASATEAEHILSSLPANILAKTLLITDLDLPVGTRDPSRPSVAAGRSIVERWASKCPTIVVTAHGRFYDEFATLIACGPDGFVPKRDGWVEELKGIVYRRFAPRKLADAELEVLTFTGTTALLDGLPIKFSPHGFAWLDALADPRPVQIGVERFRFGTDNAYAPRSKTLRELGLSLIMSATVTLDEDTARWWRDVAEHGRDRHLGEKINRVVRDTFRAYGLAWEGDLVVSDSNADEKTRAEVPWDRWLHRLNLRSVRRWTSASAFVGYGRHRLPQILFIDPDVSYAAELAHLINEIFEVEASFSLPEDAPSAAEKSRPTVVVLGRPELSPPELRELLVAVLGPTPMVALVSSDDPSLRRALLRREGGDRADWRVDRMGRVWHVVVKSGETRKDAEELAPVLFEYVQAARRRSVPMPGAGGDTVHEVIVPRFGPPVFMLDGELHDLASAARSRPEAEVAHEVLLTLAELDNIALDSGFLLRRLLLTRTRERLLARRDYRQLLKRAISTIRGAISKPLEPMCGEAAADQLATAILRGNDPYTLSGVVRVVDQIPESPLH